MAISAMTKAIRTHRIWVFVYKTASSSSQPNYTKTLASSIVQESDEGVMKLPRLT